MMMLSRHSRGVAKRCDGFTMTEVMVASMILMLFVGGFVGSFIMAIRTLNVSNNHYRATSIAQNRIQRARSFDYASLTLLNETEVAIDRHGNINSSGEFRRSTSVNTNTATAPHTVRVQVQVRYPVRTGDNLSAPLVVDNLIAVRM